MNRTDAPSKQPQPFAINGQREPILDTTPAGDNTASYASGFPPITMILKSAGGLPPKGQDMNQILYELSALCRWFSTGALNAYDSEFSAEIGGYPKSSVVLGNDESTIFISLIDANTNNPNNDSSGWLNLSKITAIAGLDGGNNKLPYFTGEYSASQTDITEIGRSIIGKNSAEDVLAVLGINETINPSKRVCIGVLGTGVFDGSKPAINIGDSDSGFVCEGDGVLGLYANGLKVAEINNTAYNVIGNLSLTNGALLLSGATDLRYFLRSTDTDNAGFSGNNVELASFFGIGLPCTYDDVTRIYFNTRTGEIGLKGNLKADGNVYSGDSWLDTSGNIQGSAWGSGVGLKSYLDNTFNKKNTASLDTNGWSRDETTGLITQWGLIAQANGTYNFPRGFPNQCFAVLVTNTNAQGSGVDNAFGYPISNNQFIAGSKNNGGGIGPYPVAFLAFGR